VDEADRGELFVTGKAACRLAADRAGRVVRGIGEAPLARANVYRERKRSLGCVVGQAFHNRAGLVGDGGDRALFACARFLRKPHCTFRISRVMILVEACPREGGDRGIAQSEKWAPVFRQNCASADKTPLAECSTRMPIIGL